VQFQEMIWCQVTVTAVESLAVGCIYRPPDTIDIKKLIDALQYVTEAKADHLLVMGDLICNIPRVDWKTFKRAQHNAVPLQCCTGL